MLEAGLPKFGVRLAILPDHTELSKEADRWRGTAASRGYDSQWKRIRLLALKRDKYLCVACLSMTPPRATSALDVDHITSLSRGGTNDLQNLQSLCRDCHNKKTAADNRS
jgi:5-methylcytosine-specific restriction enzyme A